MIEIKDIHVMVDLETLSTERNAAVFSMAAVEFDPTSHLNTPGNIPTFPTFHANFTFDSILALGLRVDGPTLEMWWDMPDEGKRFYRVDRVPVRVGIDSFFEWLDSLANVLHRSSADRLARFTLWANGTDFDIPILTNLVKACGMSGRIPWSYSSVMDVRTLCKFCNVDRQQPFEGLPYLAHNPMVDCFRQILLVKQCYDRLPKEASLGV